MKVFLGIVLFLVSLWGRGWLGGIFFREHFGFWFATIITGLCGMGYAIYLMQGDPKPKEEK